MDGLAFEAPKIGTAECSNPLPRVAFHANSQTHVAGIAFHAEGEEREEVRDVIRQTLLSRRSILVQTFYTDLVF